MKKIKYLPLLLSLIVIMNLLIPNNTYANGEITLKVQTVASVTGKTCKQIGLIANDPSKDSLNYSLLCKELNAGTKILVDNKYYISGVYSPKTITKNIYIEGITDNAEFSFTTSKDIKYLFNIQAKEIIMQKVRFTQLLNGYMYVFNIKNNQKFDKIEFTNCYFEGNLRLLTWSLKIDSKVQFIDPTISDYGITHFVFNNNMCKNLKQKNCGFIYLNDIPISHSELIGNNINNFVYSFYIQGTTGENPYKNQVAERMSYLEVRDNTVKNDTSWNGAPISSELYHCFVFFEGNKCDYFNNHIEGLHIIDQSTVVYDSYINCWNLDYEQNYWKNNICFSPTKEYADLMKSKSASTDKTDYKGLTRVYKNNTYIVEKSYADVFNRPYDELWVSLSYYQHEMDTVIVENNTFNVYKLGMRYAQPIHNYTFSNNTIHAYTLKEDYSNCILPVFNLANPSPTDTYIARDNKIVIDTPSVSSQKKTSLIMAVGKEHKVKEVKNVKIIFENNKIQWPDLKSIISSPLGVTPDIADITFSNNIIKTNKQYVKTLSSGLLSFTNNNIELL